MAVAQPVVGHAAAEDPLDARPSDCRVHSGDPRDERTSQDEHLVANSFASAAQVEDTPKAHAQAHLVLALVVVVVAKHVTRVPVDCLRSSLQQ